MPAADPEFIVRYRHKRRRFSATPISQK